MILCPRYASNMHCHIKLNCNAATRLQGDLENLLGVVPPYYPKSEPSDSIPDFGEDEQHPYHIVVV